MRIYLAGPMSRIPDHNASAFREGAKRLRDLGHDVLSPLEYDEEHGFSSYREALAADLSWICRNAEAVVLLPGHEYSPGATAERYVAAACGIPCRQIEDFLEAKP